MKKVLLLCGSHNDLGLVKALRKLGMYIILTGNILNLVGQKYADEYIQADYSDKEKILKIAIDYKIDAICQCCNDFGVYTASYVAEKLKIKGYDSYETTLLLHNKDKFKEFAVKNNINSSKFETFDNLENALNWSSNIKLPVIVKPSDCSAGNGITKVEEESQLKQAIENAFNKSRNKNILIEEFIDGTQHGFCTFLVNKKVVAFSTNNEYSILNPYRVEIDTFPASKYKLVKDELIEIIEKIAEILNLTDGIFHLQYILKDSKPYIIEVMRRVLGNMYSIPADLLTQVNWDYWETRAKCGLSCDNIPHNINIEGFFAYKTILAPKNGKIKQIKIPKYYDKYVVETFLIKSVDDEITNYKSEPIGFLFLMFATEEEMLKLLIDEYKNDIVTII